MIKVNTDIQPSDLNNKLKRFQELSAEKIRLIEYGEIIMYGNRHLFTKDN